MMYILLPRCALLLASVVGCCCLLVTSLNAQTDAHTDLKSTVNIKLNNVKFVQAIEDISEQSDVAFDLRGNLPDAKRDVSLTEQSLDAALAQILRLYGVTNHVAAYDPETQKMILVVLKTNHPPKILSSKLADKKDSLINLQLTGDKLARIREQSSIINTEMEQNVQPLPPEALERLREQSLQINWEMENNSRVLSSEQIKRVKSQSDKINSDMDDRLNTLPYFQLHDLKDQSLRIKSEMDRFCAPISADQMRRLKDQSHHIN